MSLKLGRVTWVEEIGLEVIFNGLQEVILILVNKTSQGEHASRKERWLKKKDRGISTWKRQEEGRKVMKEKTTGWLEWEEKDEGLMN